MKHIKQVLALLITLGLLVSLIVPTVSAADTGVEPTEPVETVAAEESPPEESTEPEAASEPSAETEETDQSEETSEAPAEPTEPTEPPETEATETTEEALEDEPQAEPTEEEKSLSYENNAEPQAGSSRQTKIRGKHLQSCFPRGILQVERGAADERLLPLLADYSVKIWKFGTE